MGLAKDPYTSIFLGAQIFIFGLLGFLAGLFSFALAMTANFPVIKIISIVWMIVCGLAPIIGRFL